MKLVVGLGNPGPRYADTRHNAGVRVLERFARDHGIALDARRFGSRLGRGWLAGEGPALEVALLAPETFMNRSGEAVAEAVDELGVADVAADLLVALDDVDLPFGRLRLRPAGGSGGHRGLSDVIERLARRDFARLRFGVGRPAADRETVDHVLEPFSPAEQVLLPERIARAARALESALRHGVAAAMNEFNRDPDAIAERGAHP
ncbi:MAG TPA: aminoacyl-tRNA hydrolase [Myxococcota bacterium]|nr:aminoacyl-tRNA hydrolase [Myxococcota bacterium]